MNPCDEAKCIYRQDSFRDDSKGGQLYCYMFKDAPPTCPCHHLELPDGTRPNRVRRPVSQTTVAIIAASLLSKFGR